MKLFNKLNKKNPSYKALLVVIKIMITGTILLALAHHAQLKPELIYNVFAYPSSTFAVLALCYFMVILHAWRWCRLNTAQNIALSFSQTIIPTYLGIAFNNVLPGSVGGDFVRLYYILKSFPNQKSAAVLSIFVDRISGLIGIFIIACIIAPYYLEQIHHNIALYYLLMTCVCFTVSSLLILFVTLFLFSEKVGLVSKLEIFFSTKQSFQILLPLIKAIHIYRNSKLILLESIIASILTQFLLLSAVVIISKMMGLSILSPLDYLLALVIAQVANLIPLTPGGIGVGEAAFANVIIMLNPSMTAAYATVFLVLRLLSTVAYLPGVVIVFFGLTK